MPGTKLFPRMNYQVARGMSELLVDATLTDAEWETIKSYFAARCAFCDREDTGNPRTGIIPDHLIAAKKFGTLCLGNVVPACHDCNDAKGKLDWRVYLERNHSADAAQRIRRIEAYLAAYPYQPLSDPHAMLTDREKEDYLAFLKDWDALWHRAKALRDAIKLRRGREAAATRVTAVENN